MFAIEITEKNRAKRFDSPARFETLSAAKEAMKNRVFTFISGGWYSVSMVGLGTYFFSLVGDPHGWDHSAEIVSLPNSAENAQKEQYGRQYVV